MKELPNKSLERAVNYRGRTLCAAAKCARAGMGKGRCAAVQLNRYMRGDVHPDTAMSKLAAIWFAFWVLAASPCQALTTREVEEACPIDGEKFKTTVAMSGTQFGVYLDAKPFGALLAPSPLPKCPSTGFVMYKSKFSDDELIKLREYVHSAEYKALSGVETSYYLAAKLQRQVGDDSRRIASTLLRATWQAATDDQYRRYAQETLEALKQVIGQAAGDSRAILSMEFAAGELERRLGLFEDAKRRFSALAERDEAKSGAFPEILKLQLALIEAKDAAPHKAPTAKAAERDR
jgi:hypothetical protein